MQTKKIRKEKRKKKAENYCLLLISYIREEWRRASHSGAGALAGGGRQVHGFAKSDALLL